MIANYPKRLIISMNLMIFLVTLFNTLMIIKNLFDLI
jgi:hypothetical protein